MANTGSDIDAPSPMLAVKPTASREPGRFTLPSVETQPVSQPEKGKRFWFILFAIILSTFLAILESYAVSTTLPVIVSDLRANEFVWVASAYGVASTALLPLAGGLAEVFGRRIVVLASIGLFALGGAIGGASQSMNMLIAGRVVQGAGAGGMLTLSQIILSDLVTLKERGAYNGLLGLTWAIGGGIGPLVGGALARHTTWRWLFYLNIPACGVIALFMLVFLKLSKPPSATLPVVFRRLDLVGNTLIIGSTCAVIIGLTWGGVTFAWNSPQVLVTLCVGGVGLVMFALYEWLCSDVPVVPFRLLINRTTLSGYLQISICALVNVVLLYYLPIYYQACKNASPVASGVDLLGLCFSTGPMAIIAGASITKTGRYRPQMWLAWCILVVALGLLSTVDESTSRARSVVYQVLAGTAVGAIFTATYFPVLAPLPVTSNAPALSFFVFMRTFSQIWGVTFGGALLQNELKRRLSDNIQHLIPDVNNIAYAIVPLIPSLPQSQQDEVHKAFAQSLVIMWRILIVVSGVGLLVSLPMQGLPLHTTKDESWAMEDTRERGADE